MFLIFFITALYFARTILLPVTLALVIGTFVTAVGYAPFFVALGLGDLIGAVILWTLVKPHITGTATPVTRARTGGVDAARTANACAASSCIRARSRSIYR